MTGTALSAQGQQAGLFVVNASAFPGGDSIDVYLSGFLQYEDIHFGSTTVNPYDVGFDFRVSVAPGNSTSAADTVVGLTVTLRDSYSTTLIISGDLFDSPTITQIDEPVPVTSDYEVLFVNATADRQSLDIRSRSSGPIVDDLSILDTTVVYHPFAEPIQQLDVFESDGVRRIQSFVTTFGSASPRTDMFVLAGFVDPPSAEHAPLTFFPVRTSPTPYCYLEAFGCRFRNNLGQFRFLNAANPSDPAGIGLSVNDEVVGDVGPLSVLAPVVVDAGLSPETTPWTRVTLSGSGFVLEDSIQVSYDSRSFVAVVGDRAEPASVKLVQFAVDSTAAHVDSTHIEFVHLATDVDTLTLRSRDSARIDAVLPDAGAVITAVVGRPLRISERPLAVDVYRTQRRDAVASHLLELAQFDEAVRVMAVVGNASSAEAVGLYQIPDSTGPLVRLPDALPPGVDYGDLPQPYVSIDNGFETPDRGPRHLIDGFMFLGSGVDGEDNGQPNEAANGDDLAGSGPPDDGIVFDSPWMPGSRSSLTATASYYGYLNGWIDFDRNGLFDTYEEVVRTTVVPESNEVEFNVPRSVTLTDTLYARFRLSDQPRVTPNTPYAETDSDMLFGEVEDYRILVATLTSTDADSPDQVTVDAPFPNPAEVRITIRIALPTPTQVSVYLVDVLGRTVVRSQEDSLYPTGSSQLHVDVSPIADGLYFARISVGRDQFVFPVVVRR